MAAMDERDRAEKLSWPPGEDGGYDVFDLDVERAVRPPTGAVKPPTANDAAAGSRRERGIGATVTAPPPFDAPAPGPPPARRAPTFQRDEPPHIRAGANRSRRWKMPRIPLAIPRLPRPRRPAWLTAERAAVIALALVTLGEASFIGIRLVQSRNGSPTSSSSRAKRASAATKPTASQATTAGAVGTSGRLLVDTSPTGGGIVVDGRVVGTAPVALNDVREGDHTVVVQSRHGSLSQQVHIAAGRETQVIVPLAAAVESPRPARAPRPAAAEGWLNVEAPIEMRIFERDTLVGTSAMAQIPLPPGRHSLVFANDDVRYRRAQEVMIASGKGSQVSLDLPKQAVAINALPWADVWVDGRHLGETPIGNAKLTVGRHVVVLKNPDLGERSIETVVRADQPVRIGVDLRK